MSGALAAWGKTLKIQVLPGLSAIPGRGAKLILVNHISNYGLENNLVVHKSLYLIMNVSLAHSAKQKNLDLYLVAVNLETIVNGPFSCYSTFSTNEC